MFQGKFSFFFIVNNEGDMGVGKIKDDATMSCFKEKKKFNGEGFLDIELMLEGKLRRKRIL